MTLFFFFSFSSFKISSCSAIIWLKSMSSWAFALLSFPPVSAKALMFPCDSVSSKISLCGFCSALRLCGCAKSAIPISGSIPKSCAGFAFKSIESKSIGALFVSCVGLAEAGYGKESSESVAGLASKFEGVFKSKSAF